MLVIPERSLVMKHLPVVPFATIVLVLVGMILVSPLKTAHAEGATVIHGDDDLRGGRSWRRSLSLGRPSDARAIAGARL